jgi:hypothetical protein
MSERAVLSRWLAGFLVVDLALGLALAWAAAGPKPVVVVPGVREERVLLPGEVHPQLLANFALLFALNFENYSSVTVEAQDRYSLGLVAPKMIPSMRRAAADRLELVRQGELASALLPDRSSLQVAGDRVTFRARKQHLIGEKLSWEAEFDYEIRVERALPTESNPHGLAIAGFRATRREAPGEK